MKTEWSRLILPGLKTLLAGVIFILMIGGCEYILPNKPPYVEKTSPADDAVFSIGSVVPLKVNAYDVDGSIAEVVFTAPGTSAFSDTEVPYEFDWNTAGMPEGAFMVEIKALDNDGEHYIIRTPIKLAGNPLSRAGKDTTITTPATSYVLQAESPASGTGTWTIVSGSGGLLSDIHAANATLTGSPCQTYILRWTVTNAVNQASDDVMVRFFHTPSPAFAGDDQTYTDGRSTAQLAAAVPTEGTGQWSILSGENGAISDVNIPNPVFTGQACTAYQLLYTVSTACIQSMDTVNIRFEQFEIIANAGPDQYFLDGRTAFILGANTPNVGTGTWSILSGVNGVISNVNDPQAVLSGQICQTYMLRWTVETPCGTRSDDVVITFDHLPTEASAGPDIQLTGTARSAILAANIPEQGEGVWTIVSGQGGELDDPYDAHTRFTGEPCETYILRWTISTPCDASSDQMTLVILDIPSQADAGPDQHLVDGSVETEMNANLPLNGIGSWEVISGGEGFFSDPNDPHAVFSGNLCGTYVLRWTISTACSSTFDEVTVVFNQIIVQADAGPDQKFTDGTTSTVLTGNDPGADLTGAWEIISGDGGNLEDPGNPASTFTGELGQIYLLKWSISSECAENSDLVRIAFLTVDELFDDRDSKTYSVITIGNQIWMAENLNHSISAAWPYANNLSYAATYGRLYTWEAAMVACPDGWHLPSDGEWRELEKVLGLDEETSLLEWYRGTEEGGMMKEEGFTHWLSPNTGATNVSGFSARPGGYRTVSGAYGGLNTHAGFWTSTTNDADKAMYRALHKDKAQIGRDWSEIGYGFSVRCIKD
jgi:uncharacterized protein (TIGR02145 family)